MKLSFILIGTLLSLSACSPHSSEVPGMDVKDFQAGIYGGEEVLAADAIASMTVGLYNVKLKYICTGSLYGSNLVITAAHCLQGEAKDLEVHFGVNLKKPSVIRKVVAGQRNPLYTGKIQENMADVSLLKYEGTIPEGFRPVHFLKDYGMLDKGTRIVTAGYGISSPTWRKGAGSLRKITLKVKDPTYSSTEIAVDQSLINGVCSGDSGGPAFVQTSDGKLSFWGVTSSGAGLPILRPCMFFAVFTRVDTYMPWLLETAGQL